MPVNGTKPAEGKKLGHTPPAHDWTVIPNIPYAGRKPSLLKRRVEKGPGGTRREVTVCAQTRAWWRDISSMPHCALWTATDWRFALATALVADMFFQGDRPAATELRQRELILGTTVDARRDLRIRYVDPVTRTETDPAVPVADLEERRRRLTSAS